MRNRAIEFGRYREKEGVEDRRRKKRGERQDKSCRWIATRTFTVASIK